MLKFIFILLPFFGKSQVECKIEKFVDSLDYGSHYPIVRLDAFIGNFEIVGWSDADINLRERLYPRITLYYFFKKCYIGFNPLRADEYNPKVEVGIIINIK
jgi:hypothetical protein